MHGFRAERVLCNSRRIIHMRGKYQFLDLIEEVLKVENREMTLPEIWDYAVKNGLDQKLESTGKTPINTMNSCIRRNISNGRNVRFVQTSAHPAKYNLK